MSFSVGSTLSNERSLSMLRRSDTERASPAREILAAAVGPKDPEKMLIAASRRRSAVSSRW